MTDEEVFKNLLAASFIGISKVMAKMGISTLQSYKVLLHTFIVSFVFMYVELYLLCFNIALNCM